MEFAAAVASIWTAEGMAVQADVHAPSASDGGEQPHIHYQMTMRKFAGSEFAATKERAWNRAFMADRGRAIKQKMCDAANRWLEENNIDVRVDSRNAERQRNPDLPPPESNVSKRNWKRGNGTRTRTPLVRPARRWPPGRGGSTTGQGPSHRKRPRKSRPSPGPSVPQARPHWPPAPEEKAGPLALGQHMDAGNPAPVEAVTVEADKRRAVLALTGGGQIIDRGDRIRAISRKTTNRARHPGRSSRPARMETGRGER